MNLANMLLGTRYILSYLRWCNAWDKNLWRYELSYFFLWLHVLNFFNFGFFFFIPILLLRFGSLADDREIGLQISVFFCEGIRTPGDVQAFSNGRSQGQGLAQRHGPAGENNRINPTTELHQNYARIWTIRNFIRIQIRFTRASGFCFRVIPAIYRPWDENGISVARYIRNIFFIPPTKPRALRTVAWHFSVWYSQG